jgi:hypothetical protein
MIANVSAEIGTEHLLNRSPERYANLLAVFCFFFFSFILNRVYLICFASSFLYGAGIAYQYSD